MKKLIITTTVLLAVLCFGGCGVEELPLEAYRSGIAPPSIAYITDVFELKYGEVKECNYGGQAFRFSIMDVEDNVIPLSETAYIHPDSVYKIRMHACLRIDIDGNTIYTKVSSQRWGPYKYENDGTDVQDMWDYLESMQTSKANQEDASYFPTTFSFIFGEGTLIKDTSFSIYMAKAFPFAYEMNGIPDKRAYKFIFIITDQGQECYTPASPPPAWIFD